MLILGNLLWTTTGTGFVPPTPPPAPEAPLFPPSGGIPEYRPFEERDTYYGRRAIAEPAAAVIEAVATRQVEALDLDEQQRTEELLAELKIQKIEWDSRYLTALNDRREQLIVGEIGRLIQEGQNEDDAIYLILLAASV